MKGETVATIDAPPQSVTATLREWISEEIDGKAEVEITDLQDAALAHFADDEVFVASLVQTALPHWVGQIAREVFSRQRRIVLGTAAVTGEEFEKRVAVRAARWYEHVGGGTHKTLLKMTKADLDFSIEERKTRVKTELRVIKFEQDIRSGLGSAHQTVGERYSPTQLTSIWAKHFGDNAAAKENA